MREGGGTAAEGAHLPDGRDVCRCNVAPEELPVRRVVPRGLGEEGEGEGEAETGHVSLFACALGHLFPACLCDRHHVCRVLGEAQAEVVALDLRRGQTRAGWNVRMLGPSHPPLALPSAAPTAPGSPAYTMGRSDPFALV